jgi:hypothetical protein
MPRRGQGRIAPASGGNEFRANANYFLYFLNFFFLRKNTETPILNAVEGVNIRFRFVLWKRTGKNLPCHVRDPDNSP